MARDLPFARPGINNLPTLGQLLAWQQLAQTPATFGVMGYLWVGFREAGRPGFTEFSLSYASGTGLLALVINVLVLVGEARNIARLRALMDAGTRLVDLPRDQVRRALRTYFPSAAVAGVMWTAIVAGYPFALRAVGLPLMEKDHHAVLVGGLGLGWLAAMTVFYVMQLLTALRISPLLIADGMMAAVGPFRPMRVFQHVWLIAFTMGLVIPACYGALRDLGAGTGVLTYTAGMMAVAGLVQMFAASLALARPVGHLLERMQEVGAGRLDIQARVFNLDTLGMMSAEFNRMVDGLRQREFLRATFGRYVAPEVAEEILRNGVALGGQLRTATVLFSDIRGFTRMSEQMTPQEVVRFINDYLDVMVGCVEEYKGTVDKFIGDAVMAVWGAPATTGMPETDARAAVSCALRMEERLVAFNARREARGEPAIDIGIGLHTGELVAGNIGSQNRMQYTVIGDTVNLASRLESMTKDLGCRILVSETTANLVGDAFELRPLERLQVRGRASAVEVFAVKARA